MSGSTSNDHHPTATITVKPYILLNTAALTAVGAAGIGYVMPTLFPEGHFVKPAIHYFLASLAVLYARPQGSVAVRSLGIGGLMTAQLMLLTGSGTTIDAALRYGAMASLASYVSTEYIMPQLLKGESAVLDRLY